MSLNSETLGNLIAQKLEEVFQPIPDEDPSVAENRQLAAQAIAEAVVEHIINNLSITIPAGDVITSVSGGAGAIAEGTSNISPIECDVS
jgi:hypothetical protein